MDLTQEELLFLRKQKIEPHMVFDGRFLSKTAREQAADLARLDIVLTSVRCGAAGHRLRTRRGHCIQCDTSKIAHIVGENAFSIVYLAGTLSGKLLKVGRSSDVARRMRVLRNQAYGGFHDWVVLWSGWTEQAGKRERQLRDALPGERVYGAYVKDGNVKIACEMVRCPFSIALFHFSEIVGKPWKPARILEDSRAFEFDSSSGQVSSGAILTKTNRPFG